MRLIYATSYMLALTIAGLLFASEAMSQDPPDRVTVKKPDGTTYVVNSADSPKPRKCECTATCHTVLATGQERYEDVNLGSKAGDYSCLFAAVHTCEEGFSRYFYSHSCK